MNQHDLMVSVLAAAGGEPIESHTRPGYTGKIADTLFPADDVIVEVKSLTTNRAASDETSEAVGEMFLRHTHMGAPVIFGTATNNVLPSQCGFSCQSFARRVGWPGYTALVVSGPACHPFLHAGPFPRLGGIGRSGVHSVRCGLICHLGVQQQAHCTRWFEVSNMPTRSEEAVPGKGVASQCRRPLLGCENPEPSQFNAAASD